MAEQSTTLESLAREVGVALYSLEGVLTPLNAAALFEELGLDVPCDLSADAGFTQTLERAAQRAGALVPAILAVVAARGSDDDLAAATSVGQLLAAIAQLATSLNDVASDFTRATASLPNAADLKAFAQTFVERLLGDAIVSHLETVHPFLRRVLSCLAVVETTTATVAVNGAQRTVERNRLRLDRVSQWVDDPLAVFRDAYGWGNGGFDGKALFSKIRDLFDTLLPVAVLRDADADSPADLRIDQFLIRAATDATPAGLQGQLFVDTLAPSEVVLARLTDSCRVALKTQGALAPDLTLRLLPTAQLDARAATNLTGGVALTIVGEPVDSDSTLVVLSVSDACRLEAQRVSAGLIADVTYDALAKKGTTDFRFEAKLAGGALIVEGSAADGFLGSLIPADGLRVPIDATLTLSSAHGISFNGGAGLDATFPVNLSLGPVSVPAAHLRVNASDAGLATEVSASVRAALGPVSAVIDRVGLAAELDFPRSGGNLGPIDVTLGFKPPTGVGVSVDARGVVSGGGFLFHDEAQGLYAGAMQLSLHEAITLKAFGLIATRMPDGSRGYSLIVFITAEDFRPIPLGLGFTLLGIGGLVGVNRTFDQDVLRQGLKNGTLATLLFPRDPVGNAPTLIRNLASAFPARRGSYLLGLLAKIGWFTPTLVLMDLALILEFGARERLLALGRISALLPSADNDLVRLNMEAIGVLDFDASTAAIDAVLIDSRLAHKFPITGAAALRAGFGEGPSFVLAVGGLNPHFAPPAGLPALERVAIALSSGDNPRLVCEAYFAITSNTVQFGANASLYASAAGFSVEGDVGFDVLVQLVPLHFIAEFHSRVQLKCGSHNLFMVALAGELEGPRPLRVSGKASFSILWCDFSVHFDTTLVHGEPPPLPPAVDVLAQLTQALAAPTSWSTQRSAAQTHGVALRSLPPAGPGAPLVLDPLGQLLVKQQVVPLNTARDIDTFGGAPVAGARRFALSAALDGIPLLSAPLQAAFAPAQFFVMSDDEKLAAPAFESMEAGSVFGSASTVFDPTQVIPAPLEYQPISISLTGASSPPPAARSATAAPYTLNAAQLQTFARSGAAARAPVRQVGRARFRNDTVTAAASFQPKRWTLMPNEDGPAATLDPSVRTWSEYQAALKSLNRASARYQILPTHEIEA